MSKHISKSQQRREKKKKLLFLKRNDVVLVDIKNRNVHAPPLGTIGVEHERRAVRSGGRPAGSSQPEAIPRLHHGLLGADVRAGDLARDGVVGPVGRVVEAAAAVEQDVATVAHAQEAGRLDERAVVLGTVEDRRRAAQTRHAVGLHLLQHDGRRVNRRVDIAAGPAAAQAVPVDLVHHVALAGLAVPEPRGVDGAPRRHVGRERLPRRRRVGAQDRVGRRRPDAVEPAIFAIELRAVVHDVRPVVDAVDSRRPGVFPRRPRRRRREQVVVVEELPGAEHRGRSRYLHGFAVAFRREGVPLSVGILEYGGVCEIRVEGGDGG